MVRGHWEPYWPDCWSSWRENRLPRLAETRKKAQPRFASIPPPYRAVAANSLQIKTGCLLALIFFGTAHAQTPQQAPIERLKGLSVEELMDVEVTSVSKSAEPLLDAAAAVAVVTGEDIRRSGATNIPEALRQVPGLHVAQETSSSWAVSARGFSSVNSEKLLVLSDTRSIYTPLYSGVFWDAQEYLLADIDRVEVIRGPGAALWGSNAVNGVINIQTKSAMQTQGTHLEADVGSERVAAAARYGGETNGVYYRVFAQHKQLDSTFNPTSQSDDRSRLTHAGMRTDWSAGNDRFTVQGDVYRGETGRFAPSVNVIGLSNVAGKLRTAISGGNVLARWTRTSSEDANTQLRFYYDRTHRNDPNFIDDLDTFDLDFQQRFPVASQHTLIWGANYRFTNNRNTGKVIFALDPENSRDTLVGGFVQDRWQVSDALYFDIGTKLEHNDFSGFEAQPSVRGAWRVTPSQVLWSSVSRAVRAPVRLERDIAIETTQPGANPVIIWVGNKNFDSEELLAYEAGYRWQATSSVSFDLALFRNQYQGLASLEVGSPYIDARDGRTVIPIVTKNMTDGRSQGLEALIHFMPVSSWQITLNYSNVDLELEAHGLDLNRGTFIEGSTPRHQFGLQSLLNLSANWQLDVQARSLSGIRHQPAVVDGSGLPGYTEMDVRIGWRPNNQLEFSLVGQNLLQARHIEFGTPERRGEIQRSVYGKIAWTF